MRKRNLIPLLALAGAIASAGCDVPTEIGFDCVDMIYGCGGGGGGSGGGISPVRSRWLRVTTITTGTPLDSTLVYKLNVRNDVGGAGWFISPNQSSIYGWDSNPPGKADYLVELSDVPTHCTVQGENPRTVTVPRTTIVEFQASPVETTFEVVCG